MPRVFDSGCNNSWVCGPEWDCRYGSDKLDAEGLADCLADVESDVAACHTDCGSLSDLEAARACFLDTVNCLVELCDRGFALCIKPLARAFVNCIANRWIAFVACVAAAESALESCLAAGGDYSTCYWANVAAGYVCTNAAAASPCHTYGFAACAQAEARRTAADGARDPRRNPLCIAGLIGCREAAKEAFDSTMAPHETALREGTQACILAGGDDGPAEGCIEAYQHTYDLALAAAQNTRSAAFTACCKQFQKTGLDGGDEWDDAVRDCHATRRTCIANHIGDETALAACVDDYTDCIAAISERPGCVQCGWVETDPSDGFVANALRFLPFSIFGTSP
jgi:hypothetical protein